MKLIDIKNWKFFSEKLNHLKLFHKLIFDEDGDRYNRKRLHKFSGFPFEIGSQEFKAKINEIKTKFSVSELIIIYRGGASGVARGAIAPLSGISGPPVGAKFLFSSGKITISWNFLQYL